MNPILTKARALAMPLAAGALGAVVALVAYDRIRPPSRPPAIATTVDAVALGRAYAPLLAQSYADGWIVAALKLEEGGTVADAQIELQATWSAARRAAFDTAVTPSFSRVLPAGTEPSDPAKRAQVVQLWRDFAKGLKYAR